MKNYLIKARKIENKKSYEYYHFLAQGFLAICFKYCKLKNCIQTDYRVIKSMLEKMYEKSYTDLQYRAKSLRWLEGKESTILLRELMKELGFNYWDSVDSMEHIDLLDAISCFTRV